MTPANGSIGSAVALHTPLPLRESLAKGLVFPKSEPISLSTPPVGALAAILGIEQKEEQMAKTSPGEFIRQVRTEVGKVVWPTRKETVQTAIMVLIMTVILAIFFLGVDAVFAAIVKGLLELAN